MTRPDRNRVFPGTLVVWDAFALWQEIRLGGRMRSGS